MKSRQKRLFPMFVDISEWKILIVGAGRIAQRRLETLLQFASSITVVAPEYSEEIRRLAQEGRICLKPRGYVPQDLEGMRAVFAATSQNTLNAEIGRECRENGIPVNVCSDQTLCDFHFPGVVLKEELTIGINASGKNHRKVKEARIAIEKYMQGEQSKTMEKRTIIIGSRESRLAVIQSEIVRDFIAKKNPDLNVELLTMKTTGDKILDRTLDQIGGKGLFVKELDRALLNGRSHLSVHSLKDLPMEVAGELPLLAFSKREDPRDVLILPEGVSQMDKSKPIGSSSLRRVLQLKKLFPDMECKSVRGNLQTRLRKLDEGQYSALVLAAAGVKRLHLEHRISRYFEVDEILPAAGQGILAVQGKAGEDYSYLEGYTDEDAACAALAERAFVRYLDGGCSSPVAAHAVPEGDTLTLEGLYYVESTGEYFKEQIQGKRSECERLGEELAKRMKEKYEVAKS